jgi:hypothetical protein
VKRWTLDVVRVRPTQRCPDCRRPVTRLRGHQGSAACQLSAKSIALLDRGLVPFTSLSAAGGARLVAALGGETHHTNWNIGLVFSQRPLEDDGEPWPTRAPYDQVWLPIWVRVVAEFWLDDEVQALSGTIPGRRHYETTAARDAFLLWAVRTPGVPESIEAAWRLGSRALSVLLDDLIANHWLPQTKIPESFQAKSAAT